MAEQVAALNIRLEATVAKFEAGMKRAEATMRRSTNKMERNAEQLDRRLERVGEKFGVNIPTRAIAATAAIALIGKTISEIVKNGDMVKLLEARFKALTGSAERGEKAFHNLLEISSDVGVSLDGAASAMTRFTIAGESIRATDAEVAKLTENVLKLGRIGGATTQEITAGSQQLGQALARGVLNGDELRSVLENMPLVAKAIADGLGVGVGQLRKMGEEGSLTSRKVFDAILSKTGEIDKQFSTLPVTVDRATTRMANAWTKVTAKLNDSIGLSRIWVSILNDVAESLERIANAERGANALIQELDNETRFGKRSPSGMRNPRSVGELGPLDPRAAGGDFYGNVYGRYAEIAAENYAKELAKKTGLSSTDLPAQPTYYAEIAAENYAKGLAKKTGLSITDLPAQPTYYPTMPPASTAPPPVASSSSSSGGGASSVVIDPAVVDQSIAAMERMVQTLVDQRGEIGLTGVALAEYRAKTETARMVQELETRAREEGVEITAAQRAEIEAITGAYTFLTVEIEKQNQALKDNKQAAANAKQAIESIGDAITSGIQQADSFSDALKRVALNLLNIGIQGLFGAGPLGGAFKDNGLTLFGSAKGDAFTRSGKVTAFARGGVVDRATPFQFGRGQQGVMGEAGPEAILPLKRGPGGKLGVIASGSAKNVFGDTNVYIREPGATYEEVVRAVAEGQRRTLAHIQQARRLNGNFLGD